MRETKVLTVSWLITRAAAISLLGRPSAMRRRTSSSRGVSGVSRALFSVGRMRAAHLDPDEPACHVGVEVGRAGGHGPDAVEQPVRRGVLEEEAAGVGAQGPVHAFVQVERGHHEDFDGVRHSGAGQQAGDLQAVEDRHADVHHDDVGPHLAGGVDSGPPVPALAGHLHVGLGVDDGDQAGADQHLVVADQDPDRCAHGVPPVGMRARTVKPPSALSPALPSHHGREAR